MEYLDATKLINAELAAKYLLGSKIIRTLDSGQQLIGKVVETEAYHQTDPASHTFRGKSSRNRAMFGPPAHAYIYFTYGMHYCFNITAGVDGEGSGVLIRAIEPLEGIDVMHQNRYHKVPDLGSSQTSRQLTNLTNGPAKLARAMAIDKSLYGHDLSKPPLQVTAGSKIADSNITQTTRIGISRATDTLWRFYITDNPFVSKS